MPRKIKARENYTVDASAILRLKQRLDLDTRDPVFTAAAQKLCHELTQLLMTGPKLP